MDKFLCFLVALVASVISLTNTARPPKIKALPARVTHECYQARLHADQNHDLNFVCNDYAKYPYPTGEIEDALYYAEDHWRIYLNLTSTCFQENDNFFMDEYTEPKEYSAKCVCKTKRTLLETLYAPDGQVCYVVRPREQKIYYAQCGGACKLAYDHISGYYCIQKGITTRNFLAYCRIPATGVMPANGLYAVDPRRIEDHITFNPLTLQSTYRMNTVLKNGLTYKPLGYFTELSVTLPTYCGCRGYFCY